MYRIVNTNKFYKLLVFVFLFTSFKQKAMNEGDAMQKIIVHELLQQTIHESSRPNPIFQVFKKNKKQNKKITAAVFAFPLPFGIVGLHRIYLGCAPHIPVVYIASLGGAFGVLPLIDFIVILNEADITKFNNSDKVFMWVE